LPLYEYECTRCHKRVEKIQSFSAEPLKVCEFCGGALEKLISAPAIQFKGSGWYVTDYKKSGGGTTESKPAGKDAAAPAKDAPAAGAAAKPAEASSSTAPAAAPAKSADK
jgi:putative FmdB family regulatory protein